MIEELVKDREPIQKTEPALRLSNADEFGEMEEKYEDTDVKMLYSEDYEAFDFKTSERFVKGDYGELNDSEFVGEMYDPDYEKLKEQVREYETQSLYDPAEEEIEIKKDLKKDDDDMLLLKIVENEVEGPDNEEEHENNILKFDYHAGSLYDSKSETEEETSDLGERVKRLEKKAA